MSCTSGISDPFQSSPPGRNDCPLPVPGSVKLLMVVSCGEVTDDGPMALLPPLPMDLELTGPDESQGEEEKPDRNPPSLQVLISLVWREKGVETGVWLSQCAEAVEPLTAASVSVVAWVTDVASTVSERASLGQPLCWWSATCSCSQSSLMLASEANWALTGTPEMVGSLSRPALAWMASSILEKQMRASSDW